MKINVDIDCTPLEARSFLGLPDLTPVNEAYVASLKDAINEAGSAEQMQALMRSFAPMGEAGMSLFKQMMEIGTGTVSAGSKG
jgi:Family of unknown function (DUF6489)